MQANMKSSSIVTSTMFPMVFTATKTHWTTCWNHKDNSKIEHGHILRAVGESSNLQSFCSVDGPQGPEDSQHPEDFHNWDGTRSTHQKHTRYHGVSPIVLSLTPLNTKNKYSLTCGMTVLVDSCLGRIYAFWYAVHPHYLCKLQQHHQNLKNVSCSGPPPTLGYIFCSFFFFMGMVSHGGPHGCLLVSYLFDLFQYSTETPLSPIITRETFESSWWVN